MDLKERMEFSNRPATQVFIDLVMLKHELKSYYELALFLGISTSAVYKYKNHNGVMDDEVCIRVAKALDKPAKEIIALVHEGTAKSPEAKKVWQDISGKFNSTALSILLIFIVFPYDLVREICILCKIRTQSDIDTALFE